MGRVKQYFDNHDTVNKLYFTSDRLAFFDRQNAMNHARNLDDDTVTAMTREEVDAELNALTDDDWDDELYDDNEFE